jgi:hypothetical protein
LALGGQDIIFRSIIKTDNMKSIEEQIEFLKTQIKEIEVMFGKQPSTPSPYVHRNDDDECICDQCCCVPEDNEPDPVCDGYSGCGCGCDESPVEVEDEGPEFDSAGFSKEDRVVDGQYMVTEDNKYAGHVHLTRAEMIDFATRLTERVLDSVKKAVTDMELNADDVVEIELNSWSKTIEVELDNNTLSNNVNSEIEDAINLDPDSISDEIDDIFGDMYLERIS